jgi:hypothetical protein
MSCGGGNATRRAPCDVGLAIATGFYCVGKRLLTARTAATCTDECAAGRASYVGIIESDLQLLLVLPWCRRELRVARMIKTLASAFVPSRGRCACVCDRSVLRSSSKLTPMRLVQCQALHVVNCARQAALAFRAPRRRRHRVVSEITLWSQLAHGAPASATRILKPRCVRPWWCNEPCAVGSAR